MKAKDYSDEWDAGFAAPMSETVPAALGGLRFDQALVRLFPQYSRNRLQAWLRSGHITLEKGALKAKDLVVGGERVVLTPPPPPSEVPQAQRMPLKIVFEDDALIVIDKPAGLVVHPGAGRPDRTLLNALLAHAPALAGVPRAGIVHRLDKDTSGLLVVAKTVSAQAELVKQLAARAVRRVYLAVVQGDPPASGVIDAPVGRDARARTRMAVTHRGKPLREKLVIQWDRRRPLLPYAESFREALAEYMREIFPITQPSRGRTTTERTQDAPRKTRGR